jgi:hypothetical protein
MLPRNATSTELREAPRYPPPVAYCLQVTVQNSLQLPMFDSACAHEVLREDWFGQAYCHGI